MHLTMRCKSCFRRHQLSDMRLLKVRCQKAMWKPEVADSCFTNLFSTRTQALGVQETGLLAVSMPPMRPRMEMLATKRWSRAIATLGGGCTMQVPPGPPSSECLCLCGACTPDRNQRNTTNARYERNLMRISSALVLAMLSVAVRVL